MLRKNKLEHVTFHSLRHCAATLMLLDGVNIKVVSKTLGHSTTAITQDIYQHVLDDMKREVANKMETIFAKVSIK